MYKLVLCWRYLLTRYLALVCIISVMLGVATLIVVNSVMAGFSTKLRERLHGFISDVILEADDYDGFDNPEGKMAAIRKDPFLNERIAAMTPTLEVFAMLHYSVGPTPCIRPVHLIGIDPIGRADLGGFAEFLSRPENRRQPSFDLSPEAWQVYNQRFWTGRLQGEENEDAKPLGPPAVLLPPPAPPAGNDKTPLAKPWDRHGPEAPTVLAKPPPEAPPLRKTQPIGVFVGWAISHIRQKTPEGETVEAPVIRLGDDVQLTTVKSVGREIRPATERFIVVDYLQTGMSEYDSNFVFMPLADLQEFRNLENRATSIQIRLKDYREARAVVDRLQAMFVGHPLHVQTWEDKQGPLLAAISIEKGILNVLLFMIIAVAGFGILAIFSMIVFEKTRDIGILKALGASNAGVMKIFLAYGLLLGVIGAGLGTAIGLALTFNINAIEKALSHVTGNELFDRSIYYFKDIPTDVQIWTVAMVNIGAVAIAVIFSVLPALRAALLHPVRALRYE